MKTIKFTLTPESIDKAIGELQDYQKWIEERCETLRQRVAEEIANESQIGFDSSSAEISNDGVSTQPNVTVEVTDRDGVSIVIANGSDAVWIEFGAGVYYNTPVGTSPNPYGADLGFSIGTYGYGYGARKVWGYRNADGTVTLTHGTPATMPMYNAVSKVLRDLPNIAKAVFSDG